MASLQLSETPARRTRPASAAGRTAPGSSALAGGGTSLDTLTILSHSRARLTKAWQPDGSIEPYASAKYFTRHEEPVGSLAELSALLTRLEGQSRSCLIRGRYVGEELAERDPEHRKGRVRRILGVFEDQPLHALMLDVDGFEPLAADPIAEPEAAIREFIRCTLPAAFHDAGYHWHLSSSAGRVPGVLKAHLWFWLTEPLTSAQARAWAKSLPGVDPAVFSPVQPHYTANPVMGDGVVDPIPRRSGLVEGGNVDLVVADDVLAAAEKLARKREAHLAIADPFADWLAEQGLVLGYRADGGFNVTCAWEHEHTSPTAEDAAVYFPSGTGGYDRGGWRCLHSHCEGRTVADYEVATGYIAASFDELAEGDDSNREIAPPGFARDGKGKIEATIDNVMRAVEAPEWTGTDFAYDQFFGSIVVAPHGKADWRLLDDADYVTLRRWLEKRGFKPIGRELIRDAVLGVAWHNRFDSAVDWLASLKWDGVPRIETMLPDLLGAADTPYTRAVGVYWMTAHAARVLDPGCQADMVPVLYGPQNSGKSSACVALAPSPDAYAKFDLGHKDADLSRKMRGKLVGELDELRGFQGRTAEANKAWLSQRFEEWTPKYQEFGTKLLRRMVFVGTTNRDDFLDDPTGERRWLPFEVGSIDLSALADAREQLWAEGAARWRANGVEWQRAMELAKAEHADFKKDDVWTEAVERWWLQGEPDFGPGGGRSADWSDPENGLVGFSTERVALEALGLSAAKMSNADCARLSNSLRTRGFSHVRVRVSGGRPRFWTKRTEPGQSWAVQGNV